MKANCSLQPMTAATEAPQPGDVRVPNEENIVLAAVTRDVKAARDVLRDALRGKGLPLNQPA